MAAAGWGGGLVGAVGVLWPLQLHLEPLHADLEAVHRLDGSLGTTWVVETHKPWGTGQKGERERGIRSDEVARTVRGYKRMNNEDEYQ